MHKEITRLPNPYGGRKGILNWFSKVLYPIMGPAQIGIGRPEEPYAPPDNPVCPICSQPMIAHEILRGDAHTPTRLTCPGAAA